MVTNTWETEILTDVNGLLNGPIGIDIPARPETLTLWALAMWAVDCASHVQDIGGAAAIQLNIATRAYLVGAATVQDLAAAEDAHDAAFYACPAEAAAQSACGAARCAASAARHALNARYSVDMLAAYAARCAQDAARFSAPYERKAGQKAENGARTWQANRLQAYL